MSEPELLDGYLTFRIEDSHLSIAEEEELREFATNAVAQLPSAGVRLLSRVAQLDYNSGHYELACDAAKKAIAKGTRSIDALRSMYILASSYDRLGRTEQGIAEYRRLLSHDPPEWLELGTKEALAILYERKGDLVSAFNLYRDLDYWADMNYLADAKMSPEQLAEVIKGTPRGQDRDVLQYTLAMRYFRLDDFGKARKAFLAVPAAVRPYGGQSKEEFEELWAHYDDIQAANPIKSVNDLEKLDRAVRTAKSDDAKAQALYDKAAYIYNHRNLLYYSPGLWRGDRAFMFDLYWSSITNGDQDTEARDRHFDEHECLAHSMRICQEIIEQYPDSEIRPKALYTGALSAWHLGNLNSTWRQRMEPLHKQSIQWLTLIVEKYPDHELTPSATKYARVFKNHDSYWYGR